MSSSHDMPSAHDMSSYYDMSSCYDMSCHAVASCHDMSTSHAMSESQKLSRLNLDALTVPEVFLNTIRILTIFSTPLIHPQTQTPFTNCLASISTP